MEMKLKVYERTGIKEETKLKEKKEKLIERQKSEIEIKQGIERGIYKENCKNNYDLNLMCYEKEYKRTEDLLMWYQEVSIVYEENVCILIGGYIDYFHTYGNRMTALGLRRFRKTVETVIELACRIEKKKKRNAQVENMAIDFVIEHYDGIEYFGSEINVPDIIHLMFDLGMSERNPQEYEEVKEKVKTIYEELKSD